MINVAFVYVCQTEILTYAAEHLRLNPSHCYGLGYVPTYKHIYLKLFPYLM